MWNAYPHTHDRHCSTPSPDTIGRHRNPPECALIFFLDDLSRTLYKKTD